MSSIESNWMDGSVLTFRFLVFSNWHNWINPTELFCVEVSQRWCNSKCFFYSFNSLLFGNRFVSKTILIRKRRRKKCHRCDEFCVFLLNVDVGFKPRLFWSSCLYVCLTFIWFSFISHSVTLFLICISFFCNDFDLFAQNI